MSKSLTAKRVLITLLLLALAPLASARAEGRTLAFGQPGWELTGDQSRVEQLDGREALLLRGGRAFFRELAMEDGTIEFEMRNAPARSFAYLQFRMASDREYETIYFRPHKSDLPDALQYTPVYRGASQWQLFHGPGATAAAPLPSGEWTRVKLVLKGRRAALFVGEVAEPQLLISRLAHEPRAGYLALRSFVPRGIAPDVLGGTFANVVVRPGEVDYEFPDLPTAPAEEGLISRWQVSESYLAPDETIESLPADLLASENWKTVDALPSGLVELARHVAKPEGRRGGTLLARVRIEAAKSGDHRLDLGFSDRVSLFLNGRLLFAADHRFSFDAPRRQGLIHFDQASVYLPLKKGDNELVLAITDGFGGWGVMARLDPSTGLRVRAPKR